MEFVHIFYSKIIQNKNKQIIAVFIKYLLLKFAKPFLRLNRWNLLLMLILDTGKIIKCKI